MSSKGQTAREIEDGHSYDREITEGSLRYVWHSRVEPHQIITDQDFDIDDGDFYSETAFNIRGAFSVMTINMSRAEPINGLTRKSSEDEGMVDVFALKQ